MKVNMRMSLYSLHRQDANWWDARFDMAHSITEFITFFNFIAYQL